MDFTLNASAEESEYDHISAEIEQELQSASSGVVPVAGVVPADINRVSTSSSSGANFISRPLSSVPSASHSTLPSFTPSASHSNGSNFIPQPLTSAGTNFNSHALPLAEPNFNPHATPSAGPNFNPRALPSAGSNFISPTANLTLDDTPPQDDKSSDIVLTLDGRARTGYVYSDLMMLHSDQADDEPHPECPDRIAHTKARLQSSGALGRMRRIPIREVLKGEVMLIHTEEHWDRVTQTAFLAPEVYKLTRDHFNLISIYVCPESASCARLSAGGVIEMTKAVLDGDIRNGFAIVRPPGHHAEPDFMMGFCFFNSASIAARWAIVNYPQTVKKVLILDWDVHHGNGTQKAFWEDPSVLYMSLHRHEGGEFYPGGPAGGVDQVGEGKGRGTSVNIPWPKKGMGDADYLYAFQHIVMPIAMEYGPDLVIVSAGFDAAEGDPLGGCNVTPAAYAHMTHMLSSLADGKMVIALEGGYCLDAIAESALACTKVILGELPPKYDINLQASSAATDTVHQVALVQSKFWKNIQPKRPEPRASYEEGCTFSIRDILKQNRTMEMVSKYNLLEIPLGDAALEREFSQQVLCTSNIHSAQTLVLFVHDFGNIRTEVSSAETSDLDLEYSYLVDGSAKLISWITSMNYALIDINTMKSVPDSIPSQITRIQATRTSKELVCFIWDNYISQSEAQNIILIGHGSGIAVITALINNRPEICERDITEMQYRVKAVISVPGMNSLVGIERDDDKRAWYKKVSAVFLPMDHPHRLNDVHAAKRYGNIRDTIQVDAIHALSSHMEEIKQVVEEKMNMTQAPAE